MQGLICHFPLEWDASTLEKRLSWLKTTVITEGLENLKGLRLTGETDWNHLIEHATALCVDISGLPTGQVWHFNPVSFVAHFRK